MKEMPLEPLLGRRITGVIVKHGSQPDSQVFLIFDDGTYAEIWANGGQRISAPWVGGVERARAYLATTHTVVQEAYAEVEETCPEPPAASVAADPAEARRRRVVGRFNDARYAALTTAVVRSLGSPQDGVQAIHVLGPECRQSGEDSPYRDVWEEYKVQVQGQQSIFFELYEETIRDLCASVVKAVPPDERRLLWLDSEAHFEWDDDDGDPHDSTVFDDVVNELLREVGDRAADEPLACEENDDDEPDSS